MDRHQGRWASIFPFLKSVSHCPHLTVRVITLAVFPGWKDANEVMHPKIIKFYIGV